MTSEFNRIEQWVKVLAKRPLVDGVELWIGDDAALVNPGDSAVSISVDSMVEGIHFKTQWSSAHDVGFKLIQSSVSDLAAMGATPWVIVIALSVPSDCSDNWLVGLWEGIDAACNETGTSVIGGDTTSSPGGIHLSATVLGRNAGRVLKRGGAQEGDHVYITGNLGLSAAGLELLQTKGRVDEESLLLESHLRPRARVGWGRWLVEEPRVHSCADISDGLLQDLGHIARASGRSMEIWAESLPVDPSFMMWSNSWSMERRAVFMATGGEDYELVFTASPGIEFPASMEGVSITEIGRVTSDGDPGVRLLGREGRLLDVQGSGWDHFAGNTD